ncbi:5-methylcytosine-specific restriction enzyme subunit McrC [Prauserella shujinwangii]|uniref:5-methylcytosine-specific restriction enzyme subunit McrC n=1 Tax=Prauserella shujinwangii TaxID=1453103 RepID=A0A2T0LWY8_9PSEU|nr:restriction endonuclease [Prauserella shujinwangii]PRX48541.1 5-methylcytosine-specific restriction enzyme subunit McrC [Prauserella shujinwangii]
MDPIELAETGTHYRRLTEEQAELLRDSGIVKVSRAPRSGELWQLSAKTSVGVARVGDMEVWIKPKLPIRRLLFLLGYAHNLQGWRDDPVQVSEDTGIVSAFGQLLWRQVETALRGGLYRGYRTDEETSHVMRGRVLMSQQVRRHHGRAVPMEITYDDFTPDTAENQILLAAVGRLLEEPRLDDVARNRLEAQYDQLAAVASPVRGPTLPAWQSNRRNQHYKPALELAELVWNATSPEYPRGTIRVTGFLFPLDKVFEAFLAKVLDEHLCRTHGGHLNEQKELHLDEGRTVTIRPDLVWKRGGRAAAVIDAKYKVEGKGRASELYQLLAYCSVLGARGGYLVYAGGDAQPGRYVVRNAGTRLVCYALNLDQQPEPLLAQLQRLANDVATID